MRGEIIRELLSPEKFLVVNIDVPIYRTQRLFRSFGWRYKRGPLIRNINRYIIEAIKGNFGYDLVWIDKGVFIHPDLLHKFRIHSHKLIHFTPDPAFRYQRSHLFYKGLSLYDYCITTKSFEIENYKEYGVKTIFCTQGYDPGVHRPYNDFEKKRGVVFIGHWEEEREYIISQLVEAGVQVTVAGNHWTKFSKANRNRKNLIHKGKGLFGEQYAREISGALIGLGLLSKWVPELHTTRTFEIPACGTALLTENNAEMRSIFSKEDVIYYDRPDDIVSKVTYLLGHPDELKWMSERGYAAVVRGGYSYVNLLGKIFGQIDG